MFYICRMCVCVYVCEIGAEEIGYGEKRRTGGKRRERNNMRRAKAKEEKRTCIRTDIYTSDTKFCLAILFSSHFWAISLSFCAAASFIITSTSLLPHLSLDCLLYCVCGMIMSVSCGMTVDCYETRPFTKAKIRTRMLY